MNPQNIIATWHLQDTLPSGEYIKLIGLYSGALSSFMSVIESILVEEYSIIGTIRQHTQPVYFDFYLKPCEIKTEYQEFEHLRKYIEKDRGIKLTSGSGVVQK